ncbi:TPR-like protein [Jaminaea rosea]|uniref:TPR-like protein n=1 Tax=Jaminaea rosea TaxID=1569628 RepID=A0A316UNR0_9BASI|nr:TPR-like protein [Jaminaea rosea]PWN26900.1 TPR-like protein [Jaminaea rosea]
MNAPSPPSPSQRQEHRQWQDVDPVYARNSLVIAARHLSLRGLDNAAHWALDLANSMPPTASTSAQSWFYDQASRGGSSRGQPTAAATPARRTPSSSSSSSSSYPMQSTPFLGVVPPPSSSSSLVGTANSSPQRPSQQAHAGSTLGLVDAGTPSQSNQYHPDLSTSGRFPAPFRHPPSPLANLSASADDDGRQDKTFERGESSRGEDETREGQEREEDERMGEPSSSASSPRSAHVRFASEGVAGTSFPPVEEGGEEMQDGMGGYGGLDEDSVAYDLALTSFRTGQLDRAVSTLNRSKERLQSRMRGHSRRKESARSTFLRCYAAMLIVERDAESEAGSQTSARLAALLKDLIYLPDPTPTNQVDTSLLLLLRSILLRKLKRRIEALDCVIRSLLLLPYNWTAWLELHALVEPGEVEEIAQLLPKSFMTGFWREYTERQGLSGRGRGPTGLGADRVEVLMGIFPESAYLWTALGSTRYVQQEFTSAIEAFEYALELDPYRAEGLADYSNALFLLERSEELSELAHRVSKWGSSHPEVGNHFYYQSDHVRAISSFKRATLLDPGCVAAYILLGHAFIEVKNAGAASDMYRRAISVNPRDYRPWHGLGKVYELLEGWSFAVHYYLKAAAIAPYTGIVWQSLAAVYGRMGRRSDAVGAHARHLSCVHEGDAEAQLDCIAAILNLLSGDEADEEAATHWHRRAVALLLAAADGDEGNDSVATGRWAESFVRAAKAVAGLPQAFSPPSRDALLVSADPPPTDRLENTALAHEYLKRVVAAPPASNETMDSAGDEEEKRSGERWRHEAEELIKWLNAVVGGG